MRTKQLLTLAVGMTIGIFGCDGSEDNTNIGSTSVGGAVGSGGAGTVPVGGGSPTGGQVGNTAGATALAAGGSVTTGGSPSVGGSTSMGGSPSVGGSMSKGGSPSVGGSTSKGGSASSGGSMSKGGTSSVGGSTSKGGTSSVGGSTSKGGTSSVGGSTSKGGTSSVGGSTAKGGTSSVGGSSTGPITSNCTEADSQVCAANNSNKVGKHCGLTYEIWTDSSNSCMTNTAYGFKASWTTANGNYLARKGVRPGSTSPIVTYSANYQPNGNSYLAIYGWTQNPLIEYYIVDSWGTWRPPGTTALGTVTVDGGTYDIYQSLRDNKPSIEGNKTFYQYWSVRKEKRTSGTITVAPHFEAWKKFGLTMGTFYEVSLVIEGYQSSGSADVTVSFK